jgi:hypothetical protein
MNLCTWKPMARFFSRKKGHLLADDCEGTMHSRDHAFSGYNTFEPLWNTRGRFVRIIIRLHCQITTAVKRVCKDWPRWGLNIFSYFGDSTLTHCPWPLHGRWFDCWLFNNQTSFSSLTFVGMNRLVRRSFTKCPQGNFLSSFPAIVLDMFTILNIVEKILVIYFSAVLISSLAANVCSFSAFYFNSNAFLWFHDDLFFVLHYR